MSSGAQSLLERYVRVVETWIQTLSRDIEEPILDATRRFRHQAQDARLAVFLKGVRLASALNGALLLLRAGYVQEAALSMKPARTSPSS
jgi:type VI protein secretion system component VasF